jgi:hypothetical protein
MASDMNLALGQADEYRVLVRQGRAAEAAGCRETIYTLVGRWQDGQLRLPQHVTTAMGRPDLAVQS